MLRSLARTFVRILPALLVAAFVAFYPQLEAMGYCDTGGCPEISQSSHASGGGALAGTSSGPGGAHTPDAQGADSGGAGPMAVLAAVPVSLFPLVFLTLRTPPGPVKPGCLLLSPDSPPPRPSA